ncbi:MAG: Uma2 family endonuclease [Bacteroidota bacterium]
MYKEKITKLSQVCDNTVEYTYDDYYSWLFTERVELIFGKVLPMTAPNKIHQKIAKYLYHFFFILFKDKQCEFYPAPFDVRLPVGLKKGKYTTVVQPDLSVFCDQEKLDQKGGKGAPDLVVEILSPGNSRRDMRDKFEVYEMVGVREYWIFHPVDTFVLPYVLNEAGKFVGLPAVHSPDILHSQIFPDLFFSLGEIFVA